MTAVAQSRPMLGDVALGLTFAWLLFTAAVALLTGILFAVVAGAGVGVVAFVCALVIGGAVSGVITFTWGLGSAVLVSRALAPVELPWVHATVYAGLGAGTGITAVVSYLVASGTATSVSSLDPASIVLTAAVVGVLTGGSTAGGWALATRRRRRA